MEKFLIVGAGGRESSFATNLCQNTRLYAVIDHLNPTIDEAVTKSGGAYHIASSSDPKVVTDFASAQQIDYAFVSGDNPLAAGVVDALLAKGIKAVGGTKEANRIEWDKVYSMRLMQEECPEHTPFFIIVENPEELEDAVSQFRDKDMQLVVKPQGLTGGKGVKVMPEHLPDYDASVAYAKEVLATRSSEKVLLVEKISGEEFTIMGITDGESLLMSPATYDYPFRFENDKGPGTGGMGCYTCADGSLPFLSADDLAVCENIMLRIIKRMKADKLNFNGILNGGFFKAKDGIKFMEYNSRFGDPEGINILHLMSSPLSQLVKDIWHKRLSAASVDFAKEASLIKYLVAKEYPDPSPAPLAYIFDKAKAEAMGVSLYASSTIVDPDNPSMMLTLGKSRVLALACSAAKVRDAAILVNDAIEKCLDGELEYRQDIGLI